MSHTKQTETHHLFHTSRRLSYGIALLVFIAALLPRLYQLGTFLTIDEVKWAEGAGQFLLALHSGDLAQTYWHFFPGITTAWGGAFVLWLRCLPAPDLVGCVNAQIEHLPDSIGWLRLWPVLLTSLGISGLYLGGRKLLGEDVALLAALLLAFDPFFIAHSRILNGDAGAAILMFLSLLAFLSYWFGDYDQRRILLRAQATKGQSLMPNPRSSLLLITSGVLAGLALLTKLPAPLIGLFVGGLGLVGMIGDIRLFRNLNRPVGSVIRAWLLVLLAWGGVALLTFVLLWPAMWVAPLDTLRQIYIDTFEVGQAGEGHAAFFLGQIVTDPGPWFYPYAVAFRLTPVTVVGLLVAVGWLLWRGIEWPGHRLETVRLVPHNAAMSSKPAVSHTPPDTFDTQAAIRSPALTWQLRLMLVMLAFIIFVILFSSISPKKLDRYVMAVIPALMLLAALGFIRLWRWAGIVVRRTGTFSTASLIGLIAGLQLVSALPTAPYYLTYYNPLLGGPTTAASQAPVGWGEGLERAAVYLNGLPEAETLAVSSWYGDIFQPYFVGRRASFADDGRAQLAADYVVFYVNQLQREKPYPGLVDYFQAQEPAFGVAVDSLGRVTDFYVGEDRDDDKVAWVEVYQAPAAHSAGGAPTVEGVAQLLAYKVTGSRVAGSKVVDSKVVDGEVSITLFLRVLGPLPEETTFGVELVPSGPALQAEAARHDRMRWQSIAVKGEWREGQIVEWQGRLSLSPDLLAGEYRLWAAFQFEDGSVIAEFPISDKDPSVRVK